MIAKEYRGFFWLCGYIISFGISLYGIGFYFFYHLSIQATTSFKKEIETKSFRNRIEMFNKVEEINCSYKPLNEDIDYKANTHFAEIFYKNPKVFYSSYSFPAFSYAQFFYDYKYTLSFFTSFVFPQYFVPKGRWEQINDYTRSFHRFRGHITPMGFSFRFAGQSDKTKKKYLDYHPDEALKEGCINAKKALGINTIDQELKDSRRDILLQGEDKELVINGFKALYKKEMDEYNLAVEAYEEAMKDRWAFHLRAIWFLIWNMITIFCYRMLRKLRVPIWGADFSTLMKWIRNLFKKS